MQGLILPVRSRSGCWLLVFDLDDAKATYIISGDGNKVAKQGWRTDDGGG